MSLGSVIRQARIDAGLSIDDLSERTSIRAGLLKKLKAMILQSAVVKLTHVGT